MLPTGPEIGVAVFSCSSDSRIVPASSSKSRLIVLDCSLLVLFWILWLMSQLGFIYIYPIWKWVLFCLVAVWALLVLIGYRKDMTQRWMRFFLSFIVSLPQLVQQQTICKSVLLRHLLPTIALLEVRSQPVPGKGHSQKTLCVHAHASLHSLAFSKQHWGKITKHVVL